MTVAAILKHKAAQPVAASIATVPATHSVAAVAELLAERRIGAVPVCDSSGRLLGIVSERDIIRTLAERGAATLAMTAGQLMTVDLQTATPATTVHEAMALMTHGRFRHLPVLEGDALVGIVSIGDVVNARLSDQEQEVDSLKAYVAG